MRAVVQRVASAAVEAGGERVAAIDSGLLTLVGIRSDDRAADADWMADRLVGLRVFANAAGKLDASVRDVGGSILVVSQFTLYADLGKGRRPSFASAAPASVAEPLYERLLARVAAHGVPVKSGRFGASMRVELVNDGPVTMIIDSPEG